jgi:hypothetical protein
MRAFNGGNAICVYDRKGLAEESKTEKCEYGVYVVCECGLRGEKKKIQDKRGQRDEYDTDKTC